MNLEETKTYSLKEKQPHLFREACYIYRKKYNFLWIDSLIFSLFLLMGYSFLSWVFFGVWIKIFLFFASCFVFTYIGFFILKNIAALYVEELKTVSNLESFINRNRNFCK